MPELTKIQTGFIEPQGQFPIDLGTSSAPGLKFSGDDNTGLFQSSADTLSVSAGGTTGLTVTSTGPLLADGIKLKLGSSDDLQIYHDGGTAHIDNDLGQIRMRTASSMLFYYESTSGTEDYAKFLHNGAVELYYDGGKKLETTSSGAKITGVLQVTQEYPEIRPVLDLNFATTKSLDDRISFQRNSIATYYGDDGLLKYAAHNEPRFDHDPVTRECLGLLIEDPGTNLISGAGGFGSDIRNGSNLGNAPLSDVVDGITLPDGTVGKVRRIQISSSGNSGMRWGSTGGGNANTPYSASVWARATEGTATAVIDVNDIGNNSYNLTEEWVRMTVTGTATAAYQFMDIMGSAGHDFYLWGFQIENNGLVTSYIPVEYNESNHSRGMDLPFITGENFTDFYNQSEGTLVLSADIAYLPTSNQAAVVFEDTSSTSTDLIAVGYRVGGGSSGNLGSWYQGNGSQVAFFNHNAGVTANTEFRQAFAYKKDNLASSVDGETPLTDNSGTLSTSIDRVRFGGYYADSMKAGHIRYFKYYDKRLSNAQLQGLTQR